MIAALKTEIFYHKMQLREIGIPSYVLDVKEESQLLTMLDNVRKNPWAFYDKDSGFTISLCAKIAEKYHVKNDLEKCKAYLQYGLDKVANQGHCYAREWQIDSVLKEHKFSDYNVQTAINNLQKLGTIFVSEKKNYFLSKYFDAEMAFARLLKEHHKRNGFHTGFCKEYHSSMYNDLNDKQKNVVDSIENNALIILTGLPGTGKTTTVRSICDCYGHDNVILFAPTGKAASRLTELCDIQAVTLHSYFFNEFGNRTAIDNKIVVIDEMSMCDCEIAGMVSQGIGEGCVIVLVGDQNQLPSVGPGQVLRDVLASGVGSCHHLDEIMRQSPGSIIQSAHSIHRGNNIVTGSDNEVLIYNPTNWDLEKVSRKVISNKHWGKDTQYLSVLKDKGSKIINEVAQSIINPSTQTGLQLHDKVIHTKNNKNLGEGVNNGEVGKIVKIDSNGATVEYRDKIIDYPNSLLWQLEHAFCLTIHRSQGSEYNKVVLFIQPSQITTRNLIYTGITRAKQQVLIVTPSEKCLLDGIKNIEKPRQTSLRWLLNESKQKY